MGKVIAALFKTPNNASKAVHRVKKAGIADDVTLVAKEDHTTHREHIIDKLLDAGVPDHAIKSYLTSIMGGAALVTVIADESEIPEIQSIFDEHDAFDIQAPDQQVVAM